MNDELLQHHFDEVFNALQDKDNFDIFSKSKPVTAPKIKKTFVKIVGGSTEEAVDTPSDIQSLKSYREQPRPRTNVVQREESPVSPYSSRPSSATSAIKTSVMAATESQRKSGVKNTLFECKRCGRYILGDFMKIHEETCTQEVVQPKEESAQPKEDAL